MPCRRIQRRRALAISARFCSAAYKVFFEADVPSLKKPPHRAAAAWDAFFPHGRNDFIQRQVGLLADQSQQEFRMLLKRRSTAATWPRCNAASIFPTLGPKHHYTRAEFVAVRRLSTRRTGLDRFDYSGTQVDGIRPRHRLPPQNRISAGRLTHSQALGNPHDSTRPKHALNPQDLENIAHLTLEHYNQHAKEFWEGTRNHDVNQNIAALRCCNTSRVSRLL
jgi:hypothetical protein